MVKSMTGYGRGEVAGEGLTVTVELRAVNNRYLDCTIKMPRTYLFAEDALKERIQARVGRGKLDVYVNVAHTAGDDMTVTVNEALAALRADGSYDELCESWFGAAPERGTATRSAGEAVQDSTGA